MKSVNTALIVITAFFLFLVLERIWPYFPQRGTRGDRTRRMARNIALGIPYRLVLLPLISAPLYLLALRAQPGWRGPLALPAVGWLVDFALLDLMNYYTHWLGHKSPLLWRFHAVHHLDNHLDVTTGLRVHVVEKIFFLPFKLAAFTMLSMPLAHIAFLEAFTLCNAIFHHANVRLPRRFETMLSYFLTTPAYHGVHHHAELPYTDSNYAFVLPAWDRLFGTFSVATLGKRLKPGVNGRARGRVPETLAELFLHPLVGPIRGSTLEEENVQLARSTHVRPA